MTGFLQSSGLRVTGEEKVKECCVSTDGEKTEVESPAAQRQSIPV